MKSLQIKEIVAAVRGELIQGTSSLIIDNVCTDSRQAQPGDLFIPLLGETHDAHKFIPEAIGNGVSAVLTDRDIDTDKKVAVVIVSDTNRALQDLAHHYRKKFSDLSVVGITGSVGKTSTKDMTAAMLAEKYRVKKTEGNLNNYFGLPFTLLSLTGEEEIVVLEMGMSQLGEIDELTGIAEPDIGIVTNVGSTHLESLGTVENVARGKSELIKGLSDEGIAILNYDNKYTREMDNEFTGKKKVYFGLDREADIYADQIEIDTDNLNTRFKVNYQNESRFLSLNKPGTHLIYNALAAIAVAREYDVNWHQIQRGLDRLELSSLRMDIKKYRDMIIINDTYNANPLSMKSGIKVLKNIARKRTIAVLGAMLELGSLREQAHLEIGAYVVDKDIDILIALGETGRIMARGARNRGMDEKSLYEVDNNKQAAELLQEILQPEDTVLVKGSRGVKMEEIVETVIDLGG